MNYTDAQRYFRSIAEGSDPSSGAPIAEGSALRDPAFQDAVICAICALHRAAMREQRAAGQPPNLGKPWSAAEDAQLAREFTGSLGPSAIAALHGRSIGSIESRLQKLGALTPEQRTTKDRY